MPVNAMSLPTEDLSVGFWRTAYGPRSSTLSTLKSAWVKPPEIPDPAVAKFFCAFMSRLHPAGLPSFLASFLFASPPRAPEETPSRILASVG